MLNIFFKKLNIEYILIVGIIFLSFFPNFYFEYYIVFNKFIKILFYILLSLISSYFLFKVKKKYFNYILSFFIIFILDINLDFVIFFEKINFSNIYFYNFFVKLIILLTLFLFLFYLLTFYLEKFNRKKLIIFFSLFILFFNFNNLKINYFNNYFDSKYFKIINKELNHSKKKLLVIYLDEMIGFSGIDKNIYNSKNLEESFNKTYEKNDFKFFKNAYTKYLNTSESIPASLNFDDQDLVYSINDYVTENLFNRYSRWFVKSNLLFDKFNKNEILSIENKAINYCDHRNVGYCYRNKINILKNKIGYFEPLHIDIFAFALKQSNGTINRFFWKIIKRFKKITDYSIFSFEKLMFEDDINNVRYLLKNTNYSLYFFHFIYPHKPDGIKLVNNKCVFDAKIVNKIYESINEEKKQHYQELICVNNYINDFINYLKKDGIFDNLDIIILTDTGRNFNKSEINIEPLSILFAVKSKGVLNTISSDLVISSQELFRIYFENNSDEISSQKKEKNSTNIKYFDDTKKNKTLLIKN